jgi:hypothetical protein
VGNDLVGIRETDAAEVREKVLRNPVKRVGMLFTVVISWREFLALPVTISISHKALLRLRN